VTASSVAAMAFDAQRQGFDALQEEEGVHRRERRAEGAQAFHAASHGEAEVDESVVEAHAVVARLGLGHGCKLAVVPRELARFNDDAAHRRAMAADELGVRVQRNGGAPLERLAQERAGESVVDEERQAGLIGDAGHGLYGLACMGPICRCLNEFQFRAFFPVDRSNTLRLPVIAVADNRCAGRRSWRASCCATALRRNR